jgi:ribonuclease HI
MKNLNIWTDGSCNNKSTDRVGGYGVVYDFEGQIHVHSDASLDTTSNRMELSAIICAIKTIKWSDRLKVTIFSDSQYCIRALCSTAYQFWVRSNPELINGDLWKEMCELMQDEHNHRVQFIWIKGHAKGKYPLNELADELAKEARLALIAKQLLKH